MDRGVDDLLFGIHSGHATDRRTRAHADFKGFGAAIKAVEPTAMEAMAFFDISETEICCRRGPKGVSHDERLRS